jgi:hypothetical protein
VSQDIHVGLAASTLELMVRATTVRGSPHVPKTLQYVSEQGQKSGTVQPIAMVPSVSFEGGIGVVVHLSKTKEKQINISSIEQRQHTKTPNKPP